MLKARVRRENVGNNNLLSESWTDLNSDELRLLLRERFGGGLGQYDGDDEKLYLPLARGESRIVLTFTNNNLARFPRRWPVVFIYLCYKSKSLRGIEFPVPVP